jgi:tRNA (uracil-5-)-methyltransferase TRM9
MGNLADAVDGHAPEVKVQDVLVPWVLTDHKADSEAQVFNRYYHLFVKDELQDLVESAARDDGFTVGKLPASGKWLRTIATGWEADNWWIEGEVGSV